MRKILVICLLFFIFLSRELLAQYNIQYQIIEPDMAVTSTTTDQPGGYYITSVAKNGQYVRALIVFVQFKDDNWNTSWSEWPKNQAPTNWMGTNIIDQTVTQNSTNNNLTHYFTVMSKGEFKLIGNTFHIVTPNTRDEYITMGYDRGDINRQLLSKMDTDPNYNIDFSIYDNWIKSGTGNANQTWGQDNEVDMIFMIYRNICEDRNLTLAYNLGFASSSQKYSGEASLGGGGILSVDAGSRNIDLGGFGMVSGINAFTGYNGFSYTKSIVIHEFGHHLLGGMNFHIKTGVWGIMAGYGSRCQVVNSYERHRLKWITCSENTANTTYTLTDYLTTGNAVRIPIPSTTDYYYIENHQRLNTLDNIDHSSSTAGKGVYVLYQSGTDNDDIDFYNAEGRSIWSFVHYATHPNGATVPVFSEGLQNNSTGKFDTEKITYIDPNTSATVSSTIEAYYVDNTDVFYPLFSGDGKDAMSPNYVEVLNPQSNPSLSNVGIYVYLENDQIKLNQYRVSGTLYDSPPSQPQNLQVTSSVDYHPYLTWDTNSESDISSYQVWRKMDSGSWGLLTTVTTNSYTDPQVITPVQNNDFYYKVRAKDTQNLYSVYSDEVMIEGYKIYKKGESPEETAANELPDEFVLLQNYPNPFNPTTEIRFALPVTSSVKLRIYNMMGQEIKTYESAGLSQGTHQFTWNGTNKNNEQVTSGIYIYRLRAVGQDGQIFEKCAKMTLLR